MEIFALLCAKNFSDRRTKGDRHRRPQRSRRPDGRRSGVCVEVSVQLVRFCRLSWSPGNRTAKMQNDRANSSRRRLYLAPRAPGHTRAPGQMSLRSFPAPGLAKPRPPTVSWVQLFGDTVRIPRSQCSSDQDQLETPGSRSLTDTSP